MAVKNEERNELHNIQNVLQTDKILGKRKRNIVEGLLFTTIDIVLIGNINFVPKVQLILVVFTIPTIFYFNIRGFRNRSFTEIVFAEIKFRYRRRKLHLRSIDYVRKQNNQAELIIEGESLAEKTSFIIKKLITAILKK